MSNGSEHMPERCVHAVDGPDWAGLREPTSWKERAIAAEAENEKLREQLSYAEQQWDAAEANVAELAHAVEQSEARAVNAELEWADADAHAKVNAMNASDYFRMRDERDALQARLDAMTTESRFHRLAVDGKGRIIAGRLVEEQRLVGPWTAVPEGVQP